MLKNSKNLKYDGNVRKMLVKKSNNYDTVEKY